MTISEMQKALYLLEICCGKNAEVVNITLDEVAIRQNNEFQFWKILENGELVRLGF